jgi:hypothetical protein
MRLIAIAALIMGLLPPQDVRAQFIGGVAGRTVTATNGGFSSPSSSGGKRSGTASAIGRSTTSRSWAGTTSAGSGFYGGFYGFTSAGPWIWPSPFTGGPTLFVRPPVDVSRDITVTAAIPTNPVAVAPAPDPGPFVIIRPDKPAAPPAAPPPRVEKKPADKRAKEVDLGVEPGNLPLARGAAANPKVEADRQIEAGHDAFAKGEYGLALDHFRHATTRQPDAAGAWFLLAQVQFAIGKYDDAVASISAGMKRDPDWPKSRFQSQQLYGNNRAAFEAHLQNLRGSLAADPDNPCLLFLLGVELWFDAKQDEARLLFEKAVRLAKDPAAAEAFLKK